MTREEAIEFIGQSVKSDVDMALVADAIKALENQKSIIKELENLKAEFKDRILLNQTVAIQIMEKHISELKGENK